MSTNECPIGTRQVMLTTIDNPYDPFDDFRQWFIYDEVVLQHHTSGLLARYTKSNIEASYEETHNDIEAAIDKIVLNDLTGIYQKVTRDN